MSKSARSYRRYKGRDYLDLFGVSHVSIRGLCIRPRRRGLRAEAAAAAARGREAASGGLGREDTAGRV